MAYLEAAKALYSVSRAYPNGKDWLYKTGRAATLHYTKIHHYTTFLLNWLQITMEQWLYVQAGCDSTGVQSEW
jgi:hypothetical protein